MAAEKLAAKKATTKKVPAKTSKKTTKTKEEIDENVDQTVIDSDEAEELEGTIDQEKKAKQSIYEELISLGYSENKSTWNFFGSLVMLILAGALLGGLLGIYQNTIEQDSTVSAALATGFVYNNQDISVMAPSTPTDQLCDVMVPQPTSPITNEPDSTTNRLTRTGGINSGDTSNLENPQTQQPASNNPRGQFKVIQNTDGSYQIIW